MAVHKLSILVSAVGAAKAARDLKGVDASISRIGAAGGAGIRNLTTNLTALGAAAAVAGAGIAALAVKGGIESLATLESATTAVDGAILQMGLTGQITSAQVAAWANKIEGDVQAAFDDKDIVAATATLLRFGNVTPGNLSPAMEVMTDLAAKTGDVDSAATLLAKALADPTKAAGKLAKQGIILTKAEIAQIKALDKAGKAGEAQAVILEAIDRTTEGAAAALNGPYKDALMGTTDAVEDAERALAVGFLPVIQQAADWLKTKLADPKVIGDIQSLGRSLAGAFGKAMTFVQDIDWGSVKGAMSILGTGAKMALDAFLAMPSWVQAAVVGGWGLNKLTGGGLNDIIGGALSGALKAVIPKMAIAAGIVQVNGPVAGGGLPGGKTPSVVPSTGSRAGGILSTLGAVVTAGTVAGVVNEGMKGGEGAITSVIAGNQTPEIQRQIEAGFATNRKLFFPGLDELAKLPEIIDGLVNPKKDDVASSIDALSKDTRSEGVLSRQLAAQQVAAGRAAAASSRVMATEIRNGMKVTVPVTVKVGFTIRELTAGVRVQTSYAGGYGSR